MARQVDIELVRYKAVADWTPTIGDIIIRHGWISRTKWFGVVSAVKPEDMLDIKQGGIMRELVATGGKVITLKTSEIRTALPGSYAIASCDKQLGTIIWYV